AQLLERSALRRPDADAVVDGALRLSYIELHERALTLGAALARLGVAPGHRVLIALKNRWEHVCAYWALQAIGGVAVPVNHRFAPAEMAYVLGDSGARVVLFEHATAAAVLESARDGSLRLVSADEDPPPGAVTFAELLAPVAPPSRAP